MNGDSFDAVVIGAGHNGLVCAFYLARAGMRVLVVEARDLIGGSCVTEELIPGFRFSTCANVLWGLRPKIVRDLGLYERGLKVAARRFLRVFPEGKYFYTQQYATYATVGQDTPVAAVAADSFRSALARVSARDAEAYGAWQELLDRFTAILGPHLLKRPPTIGELYAGCRDDLDYAALDAALTTSAPELARRYFESDLMQDVGYTGDLTSTNDTGSGLCFALLTALSNYSETGDPVPNGYVEGGMGRLTEAIAAAACSHGALIRTGTPVSQVLVEKGQVRGVRLANGQEVASEIVVSNTDPKRTLLQLTDPAWLSPELRRRVADLTASNATCLKLHCALSEFPAYQLQEGLSDVEIRGSTAMFCSSARDRELAKDEAKRGEIPTEPLIYSFLPSVYDATLAPPGRYTWSAWIIPVPYRLREGTWSSRKEQAAKRIFDVMDRYAPNFSRSVTDYVLYTPEDLETRMLLTDGNIHQVDGMPSQLLWQRPLPELAHYRTPVAGLYLCGAGMHPWGEVTGAPGHNAAHAVLEDVDD